MRNTLGKIDDPVRSGAAATFLASPNTGTLLAKNKKHWPAQKRLYVFICCLRLIGKKFRFYFLRIGNMLFSYVFGFQQAFSGRGVQKTVYEGRASRCVLRNKYNILVSGSEKNLICLRSILANPPADAL